MGEIDEIVQEFLVESYENLDQLDQDLVALESDPGSRELLGSIFRTIHTIKGTSGFLAFSKLEKVSHAGENLLVDLRDGVRLMDQDTTDVLLLMVDTVRGILQAIEQDGTEGEVSIDTTLVRIEEVYQARGQQSAPVAEEVAAEPATAEVPVPVMEETTEEEAPVVYLPTTEAAGGAVSEDGSADVSASEDSYLQEEDLQVVDEVVAENEVTDDEETTDQVSATVPLASVPEQEEPVALAPVASVAPSAPKPAAAPAAGMPAPAAKSDDSDHARSAADTSIRVDVGLLDALMRQAGELVLVRNRISRLAEGNPDLDFVQSSQRLTLIASEMQESVMKTRMQPIDHIWAKMPRVVRDLASSCHRKVQLVMVGGDTELDRSLLEAIKDPLTHMVRNAVDHGIESPEDRIAAGKPEKGTLTLSAYHAGGQVVVDVIDDGAGINADKVRAKAAERGLRTANELADMSDAEVCQLLFLPGFSTAEKVTNVSGRGVGMDVVRTSIEGVGGTVDVESQFGRGTTWRMRIPLTLAIMPTLSVEVNHELYAIPQVSLLELVALDAQKSGGGIEYVNSSPVYRLRGMLLPLIHLSEVLNPGSQRVNDGDAVIAVLQAENQRFGLLVDRVLNTEEIVVKPLSSKLKAIGIYAGATLLGDGRVSLILDVQAVARRALQGASAEASRAAQNAADQAMNQGDNVGQLLVVGIGDGRRVAIPLEAVTRLEHVAADRVERVGGREVIQYRGSILPMVRLDRLLGAMNYDEPTELLVVVYQRGERSVAMVVREIIDIVKDDRSKHSNIEDTGLVGSAVLKDRVTELLDVEQAVRAADPTFFTDIEMEDYAGYDAGQLTMVGA